MAVPSRVPARKRGDYARIGSRPLDRQSMEREFSEAAIVTLLWLIILIVSSVVLTNVAGPILPMRTRCSRWPPHRATSVSRLASPARR